MTDTEFSMMESALRLLGEIAENTKAHCAPGRACERQGGEPVGVEVDCPLCKRRHVGSTCSGPAPAPPAEPMVPVKCMRELHSAASDVLRHGGGGLKENLRQALDESRAACELASTNHVAATTQPAEPMVPCRDRSPYGGILCALINGHGGSHAHGDTMWSGLATEATTTQPPDEPLVPLSKFEAVAQAVVNHGALMSSQYQAALMAARAAATTQLAEPMVPLRLVEKLTTLMWREAVFSNRSARLELLDIQGKINCAALLGEVKPDYEARIHKDSGVSRVAQSVKVKT